MDELPQPLIALADRRAGVLTRVDMIAAGVSRHTAARWARGWTTLSPGVYATQPTSWLAVAWAAVLGAGDAVVSGLAAAHLAGLTREPPRVITCWTAGTTRLSGITAEEALVRYRRGIREGRGELPRTPVEVALLDSASESDADTTVSLVTRAFTQRLTTPERLTAALDAWPRVRHRGLLEQLCTRASAGIESALEWRFDSDVLRPHGLPAPERQVVLNRRRVDLAWKQFCTLVELDGHRDHEEWSRDMHRDNDHSLAGFTTLRYGWNDTCFRPCAVAAQVGAHLAAMGWAGAPTPCRRSQCMVLPRKRGKTPH